MRTLIVGITLALALGGAANAGQRPKHQACHGLDGKFALSQACREVRRGGPNAGLAKFYSTAHCRNAKGFAAKRFCRAS